LSREEMKRWIEKRLETIEKALIEGRISEEEYERLRERYEEELRSLGEEVEEPIEIARPEPLEPRRLGGVRARPRAAAPPVRPRAKAKPSLKVAMAVVLASIALTAAGLVYWGWVPSPIAAGQEAGEAPGESLGPAYTELFKLSKVKSYTYRGTVRARGRVIETVMTFEVTRSKLGSRQCIVLKVTVESQRAKLTYEIWLDEKDKSCIKIVYEAGGVKREVGCQKFQSDFPGITPVSGELKEVGSEKVKVPAGVFQCKVLEVRRGNTAVRYWVSEKAPVPVKITVMSGEEAVQELQLVRYSS